MLPLIKAGVLAMKGLNLTAKIAPMMFGIPPGVCPSIPASAVSLKRKLLRLRRSQQFQ